MPSITVTEPGKEPITLPLDKMPFVVGRSATECNLSFESLGISNKHCQIEAGGETLKIVDLNSRNHTYVNNKMIIEHYLNNGDRIALGMIVLVFNNENQKQAPAGSAGKPMATPAPAPAPPEGSPEPTFMMSGEMLRKKMELIRSGTNPAVAGGSDAASGEKPKGPLTAKEYADAFKEKKPGSGSSATVLFIVGLILGLLAGGGAGAAISYFLRH